MTHTTFWHTTDDAGRLHVHHWQPAGGSHATLLVTHGMAEHGGRYQALGQALATAGIEVYAVDLRGHGLSIQDGRAGHFADSNGWNLVIEDLRSLNHHIRCTGPQGPLFMLGHGLGSYLVMSYLMQYSCSVQGALLSGPIYLRTTLRYRLARLLARLEHLRQGGQGHSRLLHALIFTPLRRSVPRHQGRHGWLSSHPASVESYSQDPLCGFPCTNQLWLDVFEGLQRITPRQNLQQISHSLPLLLLGGEQDALHKGTRLLNLASVLRDSGKHCVDVKLYAGMRHELHNERQSGRVFRDIIAWIGQHSPPTQQSPSPTEML